MVAMTWSALFWREYVLNNFDVPVNSQNNEKLAYCTFSLANACAVACNMRRNFFLRAVDAH